jgi:hypothetical protein
MSYNINLRVINDTADTLTLVEKTCLNNNITWTSSESGHRLSMPNSGTSGLLRFKTSQGDFFSVLIGVHNYKRWCDIVVDTTLTGVELHPKYYQEAAPEFQLLWKQLPEISKKTAKGKTITVKYYVADGNALFANLSYV